MRSHGQSGRQRVIVGGVLAAAVAGLVLFAVFVGAQTSPPTTTSAGGPSTATAEPNPSKRSDAGPDRSPSAGGSTADSGTGEGQPSKSDQPLSASRPERIAIPAIDVGTQVIPIGKKSDGTLAVPKGDDIDKAAWYKNSPTPGQTGPSVIEGHIDTKDGPSVFYRLAALEPGDSIRVERADGSTVEFEVDRVRSYADDKRFPTELVYGGDLSRPSLRLITCANFNDDTGHYAGNTVVYANRTTVRG